MGIKTYSKQVCQNPKQMTRNREIIILNIPTENANFK